MSHSQTFCGLRLSQGSIFLFFAGRIEEIKGNLDAVSSHHFYTPQNKTKQIPLSTFRVENCNSQVVAECRSFVYLTNHTVQSYTHTKGWVMLLFFEMFPSLVINVSRLSHVLRSAVKLSSSGSSFTTCVTGSWCGASHTRDTGRWRTSTLTC